MSDRLEQAEQLAREWAGHETGMAGELAWACGEINTLTEALKEAAPYVRREADKVRGLTAHMTDEIAIKYRREVEATEAKIAAALAVPAPDWTTYEDDSASKHGGALFPAPAEGEEP